MLHAELKALLAARPVILAPMEDATDVVFRRICRRLGAHLCVTEFVQVERLLGGCKQTRRKVTLAPDDQPTAIQLYGENAEKLAAAARLAESFQPAFVDINCGCPSSRIAARGAGAGWLRDPMAMVAMVRGVVASTSLPVTVKTRLGVGHESHMPIVDLARRLEDTGIAALTIHGRTAKMGYQGRADLSYVAQVTAVTTLPIIVNGDIDSAEAAAQALTQTGGAGVMIGRRALNHPWIFREVRAFLDHGTCVPQPSAREQLELYRHQVQQNVQQRGERWGCEVTRRHLPGYLAGYLAAHPNGQALRSALIRCKTLSECLAYVDAELANL